MTNNKNKFMLRAIELSLTSVNNQGGPFGCVIVKNENIIAEGSNQVTKNNDPTAHAEIVTIRNEYFRSISCVYKNDYYEEIKAAKEKENPFTKKIENE